MTNPNPPYRGTLMLAIPAVGCGWNEAFWINQPSFGASEVALKELADLRLALMPSIACIDQYRVTNPNVKRASLLRPYRKPGTFTAIEHGQRYWQALLVRLSNSNGVASNVYLSGLPKFPITSGGFEYQIPKEWEAAFHKYVAGIKKYCVLLREVKAEETGEVQTSQEVLYPIEDAAIMKFTTHKRGVGHRRVSARRRRRR
jgi:hypothetical protein